MDYSNFTRATYSPPTTLPNHQATYITHTQHSMYHAHTFTHNTTHTILEQQTTALPNHSYHQQPTQHYSISSPSPNPYSTNTITHTISSPFLNQYVSHATVFDPYGYQHLSHGHEYQPYSNNSQQQIHHTSCSQPDATTTNAEITNKPLNESSISERCENELKESLEKFQKELKEANLAVVESIAVAKRVAAEQFQATHLALKASFKHLSDLSKRWRENLEENEDSLESVEEQEETDGFVVQEPSHKIHVQIAKASTDILISPKNSNTISMLFPPSLKFGNKNYESLQLPASSPPLSPLASSQPPLLTQSRPPPLLLKFTADEAQVKQPPQQLSCPPVSTPLPEFENGKYGYGKHSALSPPVLLPSAAPPSSPSNSVSAPPPTSRPPSKPPDLSLSFLISQSHLRTPPCFSNSLLINSLTRPPENVSSLIPMSPPPPKPPDLISPSDTVFVPPPAQRPPRKPPDNESTVLSLPPPPDVRY